MINDIQIRHARPDDAGVLSELIAASYARMADHYEPALFARALPKMAKANPKLLESGTYYVALVGEDAAGCGGWTLELPGGGLIEGVAHIRHFATHPEHLRKGVASRLLDHCLERAHRAGATAMRAWSTLPGEAFYTAAGFVRLRPIDVPMGPGVLLPSIEMERPLP